MAIETNLELQNTEYHEKRKGKTIVSILSGLFILTAAYLTPSLIGLYKEHKAKDNITATEKAVSALDDLVTKTAFCGATEYKTDTKTVIENAEDALARSKTGLEKAKQDFSQKKYDSARTLLDEEFKMPKNQKRNTPKTLADKSSKSLTAIVDYCNGKTARITNDIKIVIITTAVLETPFNFMIL